MESNQYRLSTSRGSQQSNCFSAQTGGFDYFMAEKHPNLGNWAYYLIKIGLLCSPLLGAEKQNKTNNLPRCGALKFWHHWPLTELSLFRWVSFADDSQMFPFFFSTKFKFLTTIFGYSMKNVFK